MKNKLDSDDELLLTKTIDINNVIIERPFMKITIIIDNFSQTNICINYRSKRNKNNICDKEFVYFTCLFINYHCIIDSC